MDERPQRPGFRRQVRRYALHPVRIVLAVAHFAVRHPVRSAIAMVCFVLGIIGLILPIMPGWVFIFAGIAALGPNNRMARWLKRKLIRLRKRFRRRFRRRFRKKLPRAENNSR